MTGWRRAESGGAQSTNLPGRTENRLGQSADEGEAESGPRWRAHLPARGHVGGQLKYVNQTSANKFTPQPLVRVCRLWQVLFHRRRGCTEARENPELFPAAARLCLEINSPPSFSFFFRLFLYELCFVYVRLLLSLGAHAGSVSSGMSAANAA